MTTTPNPDLEDDRVTEIPRVCRPLFSALVDAVLLGAPLLPAVDLAMSDPASAILLRNHLQAGLGDNIRDEGRIFERRLRPRVLNVLRPMVARIEARRLVDEIEFSEDEKMNLDAVEPSNARAEGNDAENPTREPVNLNAGREPWWVWVPARPAAASPIL